MGRSEIGFILEGAGEGEVMVPVDTIDGFGATTAGALTRACTSLLSNDFLCCSIVGGLIAGSGREDQWAGGRLRIKHDERENA